MPNTQTITVSPTMAKFLAFFGGLTDDEAERILVRFRRQAAQGPFTAEQWAAFGGAPQELARPKTTDELQRLAIHADAVAKLAAARVTFATEAEAIRKERARVASRKQDHRAAAALEELAIREQEARDAFEAAQRVEIEARPHRQLERMRRRRVLAAYEPAGYVLDGGE